MIPKRLELENFSSYDSATLDFDFNSALLVGENGAGKSSILQAIAWALYGKSKYKHADAVVKRGKKAAKVVLFFEHNNKDYKIIRKRHSQYASQNSLEFFEILPDGKEEPIKADTNSQLDSKIRDVIKSNYDVFINSSYFQQGSVSDFLNGTSSQRQKLVSSILNLDRWNTYMDAASSKLKELEKDKSILQYKLDDLENVEQSLEAKEEELDYKENLVEKNRVEISSIGDEIKSLELALGSKGAKEDIRAYKSAQERIGDLQIQLSNNKQELIKKRGALENLVDSKKKNDEALREIDKQIESLAQNLELKDKISILNDKDRKLHLLKVEHSTYKDQIENLKRADKCLACGHEYTSAEEKKREIARIESKAADLSKRIKKGEEVVGKLKEYERAIRQTEVEIEKYTSRRRNIENNIESQSLREESILDDINKISKGLDSLRDQIELAKKSLDEFKSIDLEEEKSIIENIELKRMSLAKANSERESLLYEVGAIKEKVKSLRASIEVKKKLLSDLSEVMDEMAVYSSLSRSFGRNGIQSVIIDNVVEELAKTTNDCLNKFTTVPTYVEFITQKKDSKDSWKETLDIKIRTPTGESEFESLSGGEGFRVAFSIRLALSHIQSRRMGGETQLLMLDEVSTALDPAGIELFVSIIRQLEKDIKVLVITHDDNLKEEFDHTIRVSKDASGSSFIEA